MLLGSCGFHRGGVFAAAGGTVAQGAMEEGLLSGDDVRGVSVPEFEGWLLEGTAERECESPG